MQNHLFFPQPTLDQWIMEGAADFNGTELCVHSEGGRRYRLTEAVYIAQEVTGTADTHELVGKVKSRAFLTELGAEVLEGSLIMEDNAYEVVSGWLGLPTGPTPAPVSAQSPHEEPHDDAGDLLAKFLLQNMQ